MSRRPRRYDFAPRRPPGNQHRDPDAPREGLLADLRAAALEPPASESIADLGVRAVFWVFLAYYGWFFINLEIYRSQTRVSIVDYILSMANLVFHEAGHIILSVFGDFMATLGGSLLQVLIPLIFLVAFLQQHNAFAAAVMLWWAGQSLIELAPYINDASDQRMQLLGGVTGRDVPGYHDWNNLLGRLGWLEYDQSIARLAHLGGTVCLVVGLIWAAYLLNRQRLAI